MLKLKHFSILCFVCLLFFSVSVSDKTVSFFSESLFAQETVDQEVIKQHIDSGRRYYRQRQYKEAIEEWEKVLKLDPENLKVKKYISRAQSKIGGTEASPTDKSEPKPDQPSASKVDDLIDQGRNYYRDGQYEMAIKIWEEAYKLKPDSKRLTRYLLKAREKVSGGTATPSVSTVPDTTSPSGGQPSSEEDLISKGKEFFRKGEYQRAIEEWKKALKSQPDNKKVKRYIEKAKKNLEVENIERKRMEKVDAEKPAEKTQTVDSVPAEEVPEIEPVILEDEKDLIRRDLAWCVNIAIENHREAKISLEKIKKAKIDLFIARRNFFPNLYFVYSQAQGGSGSDTGGSSASTRDFVRHRYKFQARHLVYSGGKARSEVKRAHIALDIEEKEYNRVVSQKAIEVAKVYYEVARAEANLRNYRILLKRSQDSLKLIEEQFKSGLVSELELLNLKSQINQVHSQVASSQQELSHAVLDLQNVMNIDITTPIRVYPLDDIEIFLDRRYADIPLIKNIKIFEPTQQSVDEKNQLRLDSYVIYALKHRADFAVEQLKFDKSEKELDIAKAEFLPRVEVYGELGQGAEDTARLPSELDLRTEYKAGLRFLWNIWGNSFAVKREEGSEAPSVTKVGTARTREWEVALGLLDNLEPLSERQELVVKRMEALNDLANQKNTIVEEVRDAYHNFLKAKISKDTAKSKIEFRKKTVDLYNLQRSLGELETSKLLQSESELATEKGNLFKALADYFTQLASLDAAIGKDVFFQPREEVSEEGESENDSSDAVVGDKAEADNESMSVDKAEPESELVTYSGFLFKLEKITIGPATHKIVGGYKYRKWIALARSNVIDLNQYIGKKITISGIPVKTEDWIDTVVVDNVDLVEN